MPVTEDEMYRQFCEDFRHHLQWRESLFTGFLAVIGALAIAFYHTHGDKLSFMFGPVVLLVGALLSIIFLLLDLRCSEVLQNRRAVGQAFEQRAACTGLFESMDGDTTRIPHGRVLKYLYLSSMVVLLAASVFEFLWCW